MLDIELISLKNEIAEVRLSGKMTSGDLDANSHLRVFCNDLAIKFKYILFLCEELIYVGSHGASFFVGIHEALNQKGGRLFLVGCAPEIQRPLELLLSKGFLSFYATKKDVIEIIEQNILENECYSCKESNLKRAMWCSYCNTLLKLTDQYTIVKYIGGGGAGQVYLARDERNQTFVAIKYFRNSQDSRIDREVKMGKRAYEAQVKNIAYVLDDIADRDKRFVIQNYITGNTLKHIIKNEDIMLLPFSRKLTISYNISNALRELHSLEITHRDIKPENLQVDHDDNATIIDFGIAKDDFSATLTQQGSVMGTLHYMAPELLISSHNATPSADVFSFGIILYELFHGMFPHGMSFDDIKDIARNNPPQVWRNLLYEMKTKKAYASWPGAPKEIKSILNKLLEECLRKDGSTRCGSIYINQKLKECIELYDSYIAGKIKNLSNNFMDVNKIPYFTINYKKSTEEFHKYIHKYIQKHHTH